MHLVDEEKTADGEKLPGPINTASDLDLNAMMGSLIGGIPETSAANNVALGALVSTNVAMLAPARAPHTAEKPSAEPLVAALEPAAASTTAADGGLSAWLDENGLSKVGQFDC